MGLMSRNKGKRSERELAQLLRDIGFQGARRGQQYRGGNDSADVVGIPGLHVECKHVEKLNVWDAMKQAIDEAPGDCVPAVFHRRNRTPWAVTIQAVDLVRLASKIMDALVVREER